MIFELTWNRPFLHSCKQKHKQELCEDKYAVICIKLSQTCWLSQLWCESHDFLSFVSHSYGFPGKSACSRLSTNNKTDSHFCCLDGTLSNTLSMKVAYPEQMTPCYKFHPSDYLLELKLGPQSKQGDIEINKLSDGKVFV